MENSQAIALQGSNRIIELSEDAIVSTPGSLEATPLAAGYGQTNGKNPRHDHRHGWNIGDAALRSDGGDENLWDKLQTLIEAERSDQDSEYGVSRGHLWPERAFEKRFSFDQGTF